MDKSFLRIRKTILRHNIKQVIISGEFSIWTIPFLKLYRGVKIISVVHGTELGRNFFEMDFVLLIKINRIISVSNFTININS